MRLISGEDGQAVGLLLHCQCIIDWMVYQLTCSRPYRGDQ